MSTSPSDRIPIDDLAEAFLARRRAGEPVTPEEFAASNPDLAEEILALFPALVMMEELGNDSGDRTATVAGSSGSLPAGLPVQRLGEYRLLREVGRGGMGIVYEAEQESLGRRVALKVLPAGALADPKQVRRFTREARSAAKLHHTNIVPVFGVGECDGTHFYVMQFIQGQGLDSVLDELKRLRGLRGNGARTQTRREAGEIALSLASGRFVDAEAPTVPSGGLSAIRSGNMSGSATDVSTLTETDRRFAQGVAKLGVQVADALAHAHGQGILHRDIKPSNLLLDREGNVWVADFGLAKAVGADDLTHTGDIIGTVRYMAPERFRGEADARSDVYALGLTLYELLALRPAFDEGDRASLIRQVTQETPPRLRRINRAVPLDLETIIHKAMAREPEGRYRSSQDLAEDLKRFLDGRPILARRVSTGERLYRWSRRNPALAAAMGAVALLLVATTIAAVIGMGFYRHQAEMADLARRESDLLRGEAERSRREADTRRVEAEAERQRAESNLAESRENLALARKAVDDSFTKISESSLLNVPGLRPLRKELLESSLGFYEEFSKRARGTDPTVVADLAGARYRVGRIQSELGVLIEARANYQESLALFERALGAKAAAPSALRELGEVWHRLGDLDALNGRTGPALPAYLHAVSIRERLARSGPRSSRDRLDLSRSLNGVAISTADREQQRDAYRRSLALRLETAKDLTDDPDLLHGLSESFLNCSVIIRDAGYGEEALELARRGLDYGHAGLARRPHDIEFTMDLGGLYGQIAGYCWNLGREREALELSAEGIGFEVDAVAKNPEVPGFRSYLADVLIKRLNFLRPRRQAAPEADPTRRADLLAIFETIVWLHESAPQPTKDGLALAAAAHLHRAVLLAGVGAPASPDAWSTEAKEERVLGFVDLDRAKSRGMSEAEFARAYPELRDLLEGTRPEKKRSGGRVPGPPTSWPVPRKSGTSPLAIPGRFEEDRSCAELVIAILHRLGRDGEEADRRIQALLDVCDGAATQPRSSFTEWLAIRCRLRLGGLAFERGDLATAAGHWEAIRATFDRSDRYRPQPAALRWNLGTAAVVVRNAYLSVGLWEDAAEFDRIALVTGAAASGWNLRESPVVEALCGNLDASRDAIFKALHGLDEDHPNVIDLLRAGSMLHETSDLKRLLGLAGRVRSAKPSDWNARMALAELRLAAGKYDDLRSILGEQTRYENGAAIMALAAARQGLRAEAFRRLRQLDDEMATVARQSVQALGAIRLPRSTTSDHFLAEWQRREAYRLLGERPPVIRPLALLRASSFWRLGRRDEAEKEFERSLLDADDRIAALTERARTFASIGRMDRAVADLDAARSLDSNDARPWIQEGRLAFERGDVRAGERAYARAGGLLKGRIDPFFDAGWWAVGPFPTTMDLPEEPDRSADPSRPVRSGNLRLNWNALPVQPDHFVNLRAMLVRDGSAYLLTHVYSEVERAEMLAFDGGENFQLSVNGLRILSENESAPPLANFRHVFHIRLVPGLNTILVRVSHKADVPWFRMTAVDSPAVVGMLQAEFARFPEAANSLLRAEREGRLPGAWYRLFVCDLLEFAGRRDERERILARLVDPDSQAGADPRDLSLSLAYQPQNVVPPDRVLALAEKVVASEPDNFWLKFPLGYALYRAGRYDDAIRHFRANWPQGDAYERPVRAMALAKLGRKDEAKALLREVDADFDAWCRERAGGKGTAWTNWWFDGIRRLNLRREAHREILGRPPDDSPALDRIRTQMGTLLDRTDSPTWSLDVARTIDPRSRAAMFGLAQRLMRLGRYDEVAPLIEEAVARVGLSPSDWSQGSLLYSYAGQFDRAADLFLKAYDLYPTDSSYFSDRGFLISQFFSESEVMERVLLRRPDDPFLHFVRGMERLIRRDLAGAIADFERGGPKPPSELAYIHAAALLLAGDEPGYRRLVQNHAAQFGDSKDRETCYVLARMAVLGRTPPVPVGRIIGWARLATEEGKNGWSAHVWALACLRAGDLYGARKALFDSQAYGWGTGIGLNLVAEAMILHAQGQPADALRVLDAIPDLYRSPPATLRSTPNSLHAEDWMEYEVLTKQLRPGLYDAVFPADPFSP